MLEGGVIIYLHIISFIKLALRTQFPTTRVAYLLQEVTNDSCDITIRWGKFSQKHKYKYMYLLYYTVVTRHLKQLRYYNWLHSAACFGRYLAIIRPIRNSVNYVTFISFFQWYPIVYIKNL